MVRICSHIANRLFKIGDSDLQKIGKQRTALRLDGAWSRFFSNSGTIKSSDKCDQQAGHRSCGCANGVYLYNQYGGFQI